MMGSMGRSGTSTGSLQISFFADGFRVGDVVDVPAEEGIVTCSAEEDVSTVGIAASQPGAMGNSDLYPVAVPDTMVPRIVLGNPCGDPPPPPPECFVIPNILVGQVTFGPMAPGEDCPPLVPVGLCVIDEMCQPAYAEETMREDGSMRPPFDPVACISCPCGDNEVCPYDSGMTDDMGRPMCGNGQNDCIPRPSSSGSPSPSPSALSPSPSPSVEPVYQMLVQATKGQCVTDGDDPEDECVDDSPYDNRVTLIQLLFERVLPEHCCDDSGQNIEDAFYAPPVDELEDVDLAGMTIYSRRGVNCIFYPDGNQYTDDQPREGSFDFCESDCTENCGPGGDMTKWVPVFLTGTGEGGAPFDTDAGVVYGPKIVEADVWPNTPRLRGESRASIAMAVDCAGLQTGSYAEESIAQTKIIQFPVGPAGGPCWYDPQYGETVCAAGGLRGSTANRAYRDIEGTFYENCPEDNDGPCPRFFAFNCPDLVSKKDF